MLIKNLSSVHKNTDKHFKTTVNNRRRMDEVGKEKGVGSGVGSGSGYIRGRYG
jgi:hypothetical protein